MVRSIDEVLRTLDAMLADMLARRSRMALFTALYRRVTARVGEGVRTGYFEDGPRMDRFDAAFAWRYVEAVQALRAGDAPTKSWRVAFAAAEDVKVTCLQHLLLGMNAHINLDLGVAAAQFAPGAALADMRGDFERINGILAEELDAVQRTLGAASPMLHLLDRFCGRLDERVAEFAIQKARQRSWRVATILAHLPADHHEPAIALLDQETANLGRLILRPDPLTASAMALVRQAESDDVVALAAALRGV